MRVFISWSGEVSQKAASILRDWLPSVIQAVQPYMSTEDIDKGSRWGQDLGEALSSLGVGILCLTRENLTAPWINFEAGALSKSLDNSRVMPFLLGIPKSQVPWPLAQFQLTSYEVEDVRRLVRSMNASCDPSPCVATTVLDRAFERWWPDLKDSLDPLAKDDENQLRESQPARRVDQGIILEELLELARDQHRMLLSQDRPLTVSDIDRITSRMRRGVREIRETSEEDRMLRDAVEFAYEHLEVLTEQAKLGDIPSEYLRDQLESMSSAVEYAARRLQVPRAVQSPRIPVARVIDPSERAKRRE